MEILKCLIVLFAACTMPAANARFANVKVNLEMTVAEDRHNLSEDMVRICSQETEISMDDLNKFRKNNFINSNEATQCFAHCIYEQMGLIRNGVFVQRDASSVLADMTEPKNLIFKECMGIKGENKCETAFKIHKCRHDVRMRFLGEKPEESPSTTTPQAV